MRSTTKPKPKKAVSPAVAIIAIIVVIGIITLIGMSFMKPKGDKFMKRGNQSVYQQREKNAKIWADEQKKAAAEGRAPNGDLQPVLSPGAAETVGSLKRKGLLNGRSMAPGAQPPPVGN